MLVLLAASQPALAEIRIIPDRIAVAQWPAGRTVEVTTWAINTGDDTAQLARLDVGDDAALAGIDFTPRRLEPGAAEPITLRFVAPGENEMRVSEVRLIESDQTAHDLRAPPDARGNKWRAYRCRPHDPASGFSQRL